MTLLADIESIKNDIAGVLQVGTEQVPLSQKELLLFGMLRLLLNGGVNEGNGSEELLTAIQQINRPSVELRARMFLVNNAIWTSPQSVKAIAISNRGDVAGTFTDINESNVSASISIEPKATLSWSVSDGIDTIAPITINASGTLILVSWLQEISPPS